jgi:hypothetical protein
VENKVVVSKLAFKPLLGFESSLPQAFGFSGDKKFFSSLPYNIAGRQDEGFQPALSLPQ